MPREHQYFVYILASRSRTLYIGVTNSLVRRLREHRAGTADSFTARYRIHRLVYFERFQYIDNAIARDKILKHCLRQEKIDLIQTLNPTWQDLAAPDYRPELNLSSSSAARRMTDNKIKIIAARQLLTIDRRVASSTSLRTPP